MEALLKSDYYYDLPQELIAQDPLEDRSSSRLMFLNKKTGELSHHSFKDVIEFLNPGDCLVLNNTKVDRSAAYAARYVAKNIVAAGLAEKCEIQLSYAIGVAQPTSVMVDTFGTGKISDEALVDVIRDNFDLRPAGIIKMLDLRRPIYKQTAAYGHFGRHDLDLPWEKTDKVDLLKKYL